MQISRLDLNGRSVRYYDVSMYSWMPYTVRIIMESIARNIDGRSITEDDLNTIKGWEPSRAVEVPFKPARVIMQDYTGVPALVDLALMREIVANNGLDPRVVNPLVPVDLVIDHSVQVDHWGSSDALTLNMRLELDRNRERYEFLRWAEQAFRNFRLFPPGTGIIHQVNLEHIARVAVLEQDTVYFDTCLGMDSHTTMINGLGVLGWGVGGIEAEAAVLGQPVSIVPDVVGVRLYNQPREGVTATDIVLTITELLRRHGVVDKFLEFFGEGVGSLSVPDRATIANMAPEYGATAALFPVDDATIGYLRLTGRDDPHVALVEAYYRAQGMYGHAGKDVHYSRVVEFDLSSVEPSIAGPSLPWERRRLEDAYDGVARLSDGKGREVLVKIDGEEQRLRDGSVVIAAITSCTNTSNPYLMVAAALLAKRAYELGLRVPRHVKTSLAPGSRVVEVYLKRAGLLRYLEMLGFNIVGYGCTTCIGNSGPLPPQISDAIRKSGVVAAAVLSGNRNFEGRINPDVRANYLMSPPLVVAYALAGRIMDISREPIGYTTDGTPVYLRDVWPSSKEVDEALSRVIRREDFGMYSMLGDLVPEWEGIHAEGGDMYRWDDNNTFVKRPPFLDDFGLGKEEGERRASGIVGARALMVFGDNVTTDHISPAGPITPDSDAGRYLLSLGVNMARLNTFGARRGNWEVMVRGTFTGRVENRMLRYKGVEARGMKGGYTVHYPSGEVMSVYDAAMRYMREGVPLVVIAGKNYGAGSSRDWAAKGPKLLGVRAVMAESFERIHRSNLVEMGILPLQFIDCNADTLAIKGDETFDVLVDDLKPRKVLEVVIHRADGSMGRARVLARIDTEMELRYYMSGSILHYVLAEVIRGNIQ
ncbi:MAG: aconitate hydratase AcnA [Candidatus Nitrosocaldus sp.]|nr:aconitate hydratase AcnA [Candidatus Nitrosocaldus sp.]MDW8274768.1 aconitate hydratase AcnA [Candidatus Nitrosocaldus sp.]